MQSFLLSVIVINCLAWSSNANFAGPFLFWGHERVVNLQPRTLVEASELDFATLYRQSKAIVIFVRNSTCRLDANKFPKFEKLVKDNAWSYLPQRSLVAEPFNYNANVEVIHLTGSTADEDNELISRFNDSIKTYGRGEVLGILANREDTTHFIMKRQTVRVEKGESDKGEEKTVEKEKTEGEGNTAAPSEETISDDNSVTYVADGQKAMLYVGSVPALNISKTPISLRKHKKAITFDDQRQKGYGRLNIIFAVDNEKLFLRFNFTLSRRNWALRAVELEYKELKTVLTTAGNSYEIPSAPLGFSYYCKPTPILFTNGNDTLVLKDYQVQPWMDGTKRFGDVYDCIGFVSAPILAGIMITFFLCGILSIGLLALMDIKTPNRFESARNKQLTFTVQE